MNKDILVIKRNGKTVEFNQEKIYNAILKCVIETDNMDDEWTGTREREQDFARKVTNIVVPLCYNNISVEQIQDLVVETLLRLENYNYAKSYISYRAIQEHKRNTSLKKLFDKMGDIINLGNDENSNKDYKQQSVIRDTIAGEYFREALFKKLPKDIAGAHRTKLIHWHKQNCAYI